MHSGHSFRATRPPRRLRPVPTHESAHQYLEPSSPSPSPSPSDSSVRSSPAIRSAPVSPSSPLLSSLSPAEQVTPTGVGTTSVNIAELKRKSVPELQEMAEDFSIEDSAGLRKQDLIFRI